MCSSIKWSVSMIKDENQKIIEEYAKLYKIICDLNDEYIKSFKIRIECEVKMINNHYENKPLSIFKKKYHIWKNKLD